MAWLPVLGRAVAVLAARDPEHPGLIDPMINQVLALIELRDPAAVATADRLVVIASRDGGAGAPAAWYPLGALPGREAAVTGEVVDLEVALSQAHLARGDRARARDLAIAARRRLVVDETPAQRVAEIDAHLRALGLDPATAGAASGAPAP